MDLATLYSLYQKHPVICTDTRNIQRDCIFFALSGSNFDGNKFVNEALDKGAAFAVTNNPSLSGERLIHVADTLKSLQSLANLHRRQFTHPFVAITGTNGKTTTKELVTTVLSRKFKIHATVGNFNNHIGVPLTLLSMPSDTEMAVIEMGANHVGEIKMLCEIAMPTHGLITNIGVAHLEGFGSVEGIKKAKGELFDYLRENNGFAFVNADDSNVRELGEKVRKKTTYGFKKEFSPENRMVYSISDSNHGFILNDVKKDVQIRSTMFGEYNASNMLAAYTVGTHFNVGIDSIIEALSTFVPGANRSEMVMFEGCTIIKDAYNANPSSMELALRAFVSRYPDGWIILGSMKELGSESDNAHRHIIDVIQSSGIRKVILVGNEFQRSMKDISTLNQMQFFNSIEDVKKVWNWNHCRDQAILLKGSRSMHLEKLLE